MRPLERRAEHAMIAAAIVLAGYAVAWLFGLV